jgi:O-antigen/teichoic acid export membrane protein
MQAKQFVKDTFIYGLATVLPRVINFLLVKVHTDSLKTSDYAANTDFYIWAAFLAVLLTFGMETSFFRFYNAENNKNKLMTTAFITMLSTVILLALFLIIFNNTFLNIFEFTNNPFRIKLLFGVLAFDTLSMIPFAYLRITNKSKKYAIIKLINVLIIVSINLVFIKYIPEYIEAGKKMPKIVTNNFHKIDLVDYIFIANLIGSGVSFLLLTPYLFKFKFNFDIQLLKKMLKYSWPIIIAGIAYIINENLDKFLIKRLIGDSEMGIYSACYKLSIFMNLYIMAFRLGAEPLFFNLSEKKNAKVIYSKIMTYFVIIGALVFLCIVVYIDLFKNFINSNYWDALMVVPIVLLANLFLGIYHNLSIWYKLTDKTYYGMYFSIIGAIITIILNLLLIPSFGFIASAWITLVAYSMMSLMSYFYGKKYYKIPYDIGKINLYLLSSILLSSISFLYFRNNLWVSSIMIISFIGYIIINERKEILTLVKKN